MNEQLEGGTIPTWTLGWRLQRALTHAGITSNQMADDLEVSRTTISRWINDRGSPPRSMYIRDWADRCGVSLKWLCHGNPDDAPPEPGTRSRSNYMQSNSTVLIAQRIAA